MDETPTMVRRVRLPRFVAAMSPSERQHYETKRAQKIEADTASYLVVMRVHPAYAGISDSVLGAIARAMAIAEHASYELGYQAAHSTTHVGRPIGGPNTASEPLHQLHARIEHVALRHRGAICFYG